jgi:Domain of unknown function (DUF4145)
MPPPKDFSCHLLRPNGPVNGLNSVRAICPYCNTASTFEIKSHVVNVLVNAGTEMRIVIECNYAPCGRQSFVFLRLAQGAISLHSTESFFMYPSRAISPRHPALPVAIAEDWEEAQKAIEAGIVKAAAVMARRVLYGVLLAKGCKLRPLTEGCQELITKERLPAMLDSWLPAITEDGHDAAHPDRSLNVSSTNIQETMAYTAELLRFLYIEPYEFKQRIARNAPAATPVKS